MFYVIVNQIGSYLHHNEERYTNDYENAAQYNTVKDAECGLELGCKVVGPCKEGEEP